MKKICPLLKYECTEFNCMFYDSEDHYCLLVQAALSLWKMTDSEVCDGWSIGDIVEQLEDIKEELKEGIIVWNRE